MKISHTALTAALLLATATVFAQPGKLPDDNRQRGEQMIPRDVMPPARDIKASPPKSEAQKAADAREDRGEQMRPKPPSELRSAAPTTQTEAERKAALTKERGEQMRPSIDPKK